MDKTIDSITLLLLNGIYFLFRYLLSHIVFMVTYSWVVIEMGSEQAYQTTWVKVLAYMSISAWFMWGLNITRQPKFLFACWAIFIGAQAASFGGYDGLSIFLTALCILLCCFKLYITRHQNASYIMKRWA